MRKRKQTAARSVREHAKQCALAQVKKLAAETMRDELADQGIDPDSPEAGWLVAMLTRGEGTEAEKETNEVAKDVRANPAVNGPAR
jgi:hypothetical protein